ncbi:DUF4123 domain-containing protein [Salmonella enterica]|nr:DUF4123 domain-containing protein [Salmonella enterica]ECC3256269.1 DUF4123 domain-containing protein [Salmonella enterica subsp. enterica]EDS4738572.1 DUF4123 domain-containing protein [Salmonella enterica subsp. enterica serovar Oranienburg]EAX6604129.1 DUF4123 domain-containing protein [Salmonella enterica]EDU8878123.1 DUF4123 domain-containing protein [Salmonella enterica subsp. enterica]
MTTVPTWPMDTHKHTAWLEQIELRCSAAGLDYIDLLVDQAGTDQPLQDMMCQLSPAIRWFALFEGTPEAETMEYSPVVMRLYFTFNSHRMYLEQLIQYFSGTPRLTLLISPLAFDLLGRHLQALSQVQWEEQTGLLRYYDNRVFSSLFTHVLTDEQQAAFTDIALFWGWRNRDDEQVWKAGSFSPDHRLTNKPEMFRVDDAQVGLMGCISDAEALMKEKSLSDITQESYFARCLNTAIQANEAKYFGALRDFKG